MRTRFNWHGAAGLAFVALSGLLVLQGCTAALNAVTAPPAPAPAPIVASVAVCPTVHEFSPDQNSALASALANVQARAKAGNPAPDDAIWITVAADDQKQRAQARACNAAK